MQEPRQKDERDATENLQAKTLSVSTPHYVLVASVGVFDNNIYSFHAVMETGSGYNLIRQDALMLYWQR